MLRRTLFGTALAATLAAAGAAQAQQTLKIGVILPYSGQFADLATQLDNGIKLYVQQNGDTVAGRKIEIVRKDVGGIAPDVAKRLAQELVVRDRVDVLAGFALTPNAMAAGDVSEQAKKFMVVMNAATSIITTKSPFMTRTSLTTPQLNDTLGKWVAKNGGKRAFTMASDYGPGHDGEQAFQKAFREAGGEIVGAVRIPVENPDFSAFVQRAKDSGADVVYVWVPGGAQPAALGKALAERGLANTGVKIVGQGELTSEEALKSMGDAGLGIITAFNYDYTHDSAKNRDFVTAYRRAYNRNPDLFSVGGYDGMHVIYEAVKKAAGRTDGQVLIDAVKGMAWESPRGPVSIDAETRDIINTVYIRRVERRNGELVNAEIDRVERVKDPVKAAMR
ncbi:MAG: ABC transporter substrate-binding protein [Rhodospirillales bacterium]